MIVFERRRMTVVAAALAVLLVLSSCAGDDAGAGSGTQEKTKIRIGTGAFSVTPSAILLAEKMGYFDEEGLDVELFETGGGANTLSAVISGSADFGAVVLKDTIDAARKQDVFAVTVALLIGSETGGLVIRKKFADERGITADMSLAEKVKRLKGARLATQGLGSAQEARWRLAFREYGGMDASKDAKLLVIQGGTGPQVAALKTDQVDALTAAPPVPEQLVADGDAIWLANLMLGDIAPLKDVPFFGMATNEKNIKDRPEVIQAATKAVARAEKLVQDDPDTARDALYEGYFSDISKEVWADVFTGLQQAIAKSPVMTPDAVNRLYKATYDEAPDALADRLFNRSFAEKAVAEAN